MSSLLRPLRWKSTSVLNLGKRVNGTSHSVAASQQPGVVRIQPVKFRRKWLGRTVTACIVYYCAYKVYSKIVWKPVGKLLDEIDKEEAKMSKSEREKLEKEMEDIPPLALPLPGTMKMVEPVPYKGSDPEWQEFAKFSRNGQLRNAVKANLAEMAKKTIERHPGLSRTCGKDVKVRAMWFEFDYPYKPPPTFERKALEYGDDGFAVVTQGVDTPMALKLGRIFNPEPLALSMFAFHSALLKQNATTMAKYFGYESKSQGPKDDVQQAIEKVREKMNAQQQKPDMPSATKRQAADGSPTDSATMQKPDAPAQSPVGASSDSVSATPDGLSQSKKKMSAKEIYGIQKMSEHTSGPWQAFKKQFAQKWKPWQMPVNYPPRGSIMVTGLVELEGPKGNVVVDMHAWFDPKNNSFDGPTLRIALRNIKPRQRIPMRS